MRLTEPAQRDLKLLISRAADLAHIVVAAKAQAPGSQPDTLLGAISADVGIPRIELRSLFNSLENIRAIEEDQGSLETALDRIQSGLPSDLAKAFQEARPQIIEAATAYDRDNPVSLSFKAQRLTYLRERLFHDAEIITDARPIYDHSGTSIVEFVITHELVVTNYVNGEFVTEHMSVDNADIIKLRRACDRAIVKSKTLKEALETKWKAEVLRDDADT